MPQDSKQIGSTGRNVSLSAEAQSQKIQDTNADRRYYVQTKTRKLEETCREGAVHFIQQKPSPFEVRSSKSEGNQTRFLTQREVSRPAQKDQQKRSISFHTNKNSFHTKSTTAASDTLHYINSKAMNRLAIQLNNRGVEELKQGNMFQALELLSNASSIVTQGNHVHVDSPGQTFRYHWEDCSSSLAPQPSKSLQVSNEGSMSFLCLRLLRVTIPEGHDELDIICPW
jgi:hypothetical protein